MSTLELKQELRGFMDTKDKKTTEKFYKMSKD